jgi:hypothetical protein
MSDYRNNFHEDQLQHYVLKAQNLKADGGQVGCSPRKKASQKSLREVLELGTCNESTRRNLLQRVSESELDPVAVFLSRCPEKDRERMRALFQ